MKVRHGFVSNSSSSSFVVISVGNKELYVDGNTDMDACGWLTIPIDEMIEKLQEAKAKGIYKVSIEHGGGYDG